ncbi:hypothetical protein LINPERHAP1_LOCUS37605 [Linum perenne]
MNPRRRDTTLLFQMPKERSRMVGRELSIVLMLWLPKQKPSMRLRT